LKIRKGHATISKEKQELVRQLWTGAIPGDDESYLGIKAIAKQADVDPDTVRRWVDKQEWERQCFYFGTCGNVVAKYAKKLCIECQKGSTKTRRYREAHSEETKAAVLAYAQSEHGKEVRRKNLRDFLRKQRDEILAYFKEKYGDPIQCQGKWHVGDRSLQDADVKIDHVIPRPMKGVDSSCHGYRTWKVISNLQPLCNSCNKKKGKGDEEFRQSVKELSRKPYVEIYKEIFPYKQT